MNTVTRVGVSFEPDLLKRFDELIRRKGYPSRSEAIRDLVRESLIESEIEDESADIVGSITIVYDHEAGDVTNKLLHIQHHSHPDISATSHVHIDERMCLEVMIVRGKAGDVRRLADNVSALKGVKHGELVMTRSSL